MEIEAILSLGMFLATIAALMAGFPVGLTLAGVALIAALLGMATGHFNPLFLRVFPDRILGAMENQTLIAIPLFVIMGVVLERSRVAQDLLHVAGRLLARVRGGLAYAVILVGALLAASTGIVGATVVTMTLIALPPMLRQGYPVPLATGTIAASGTLGQIIPPSIVLILLADSISNAAQAARFATGRDIIVSVGDLFAGALVPGLLLVLVYLTFIFVLGIVRPKAVPRLSEDTHFAEPLTRQEVLYGLLAPLALIGAVLGSILAGLATPTEAAGIGAAGAVLLAGLRLTRDPLTRKVILAGLFAALGLVLTGAFTNLRNAEAGDTGTQTLLIVMAGALTLIFIGALVTGFLALRRAGEFTPAITSAVHITSMVFLILIGAALFSLVFRGFGGDEQVTALLKSLPGGKWGALAATMLLMFALGFFLDFIEIIFVVVPLVAPALIILGVDPIWLAILMALNLQTSFLTPPFGFALFYLRGSAPEGVRTADIWRGAVPFIGLQLLVVLIVALFPVLATALPAMAAR
jgi:tripartite ATP-independent transporter DctM subunit